MAAIAQFLEASSAPNRANGGRTKRLAAAAICLLAAGGCTTSPAEQAAALSPQDPKWNAQECVEIRAAAANYRERELNWAGGALIGPYGLAIVAAGKEHQEKQRKLFARDIHMACSSLPLPKELQIDPSIRRSTYSG